MVLQSSVQNRSSKQRLEQSMRARIEVNLCFSPQVDFGKSVIIVRVATQGRQDYRQWVTHYYLRFGLDGIHFVDYKQKHTRKVRIKQNSFFLQTLL